MSLPPAIPQPYVPRNRSLVLQGPKRRLDKRSQLRIWWREIDRVLLGLILALMAIGTVAVAAGSPASARRLSTATVKLDDLYFYWLHLKFQLVGLMVMLGISMVPKEWARRGAWSSGDSVIRLTYHSFAGPPYGFSTELFAQASAGVSSRAAARSARVTRSHSSSTNTVEISAVAAVQRNTGA